MEHTLLLWGGFGIFLTVMMALDMGLFGGKNDDMPLRHALMRTAGWVGLAMAFNAGVFWQRGQKTGLEFMTGYFIEQALSVDNIFVFVVIFKYFRVPPAQQKKALFWGIIGALLMRGVFIIAGVHLIRRFEWLMYVFGAFLVYTGLKLIQPGGEAEVHPEDNIVLKLFRRVMPVAADYHGSSFFVRRGGYLNATPLFVVVLLIETTDLLFALDSIPAVLAISQDPFIVFTSNVFAIMGLRSLYFAVSGVMGMFHHLHFGLAAVLIFIGLKMLGLYFKIHIPIAVSLGFIVTAITLSIVASLRWPLPKAATVEAPEDLESPEKADGGDDAEPRG